MKLDYSALSQPVTPEDIAEFNKKQGQGRQSKRSLVIVSLIAAGIIYGFMMSGGSQLPTGLIIIAIIALISVPFILANNRANLKKKVRLYKFTRNNHIDLILNGGVPPYPGMIFDEGYSQITLQALQFPDGTEIGNYQYTTGSGKHRQDHQWGYAVIKLTRKLPHMVLDAKSNNLFGFSNLPDSFRGQKLALEGDFNDHFTLYAPSEYGRDAFYVFTPDVMAALIDSGNAYDIEIIDDQLIFYKKGAIALDSEAGLSPLIATIDKIASELRDQTHRYADERINNPTVDIVATPGRRLHKSISIGTIALTVIGVLYFAIIIFG